MGKDLQHSALAEAVSVAGSQSELARLIRVSSTSVWRMLNRARRASAEYVLAIEAATGVSRHDLRPDLYPREDAAGETGSDNSPEGIAA